MSEKTVIGFDIPIDDDTTMSMLNSDPAAVYRRLRQRTPIVRLKAIGRIVFTKADDVRRVKVDTEHFGSNDVTTPMQRAFGGHTLMRKDGCEHMRE
ncbi:MAG: cytochrome P450, partial [Rhodobacterales bacterium]